MQWKFFSSSSFLPRVRDREKAKFPFMIREKRRGKRAFPRKQSAKRRFSVRFCENHFSDCVSRITHKLDTPRVEFATAATATGAPFMRFISLYLITRARALGLPILRLCGLIRLSIVFECNVLLVCLVTKIDVSRGRKDDGPRRYTVKILR